MSRIRPVDKSLKTSPPYGIIETRGEHDGRQSGQISMMVLDIAELIVENHLLRKVSQLVSFEFTYNFIAP